jgi:hypothetical protein
MRYLILLWGDAAAEAALSGDERRAIVEEHRRLSERLRHDRKLVHGDPLAPGGKVVREGLVTDGPFVETKEQVGGYYIVEVESEEEALAIAHEMPRSPGLAAEVLPTFAV